MDGQQKCFDSRESAMRYQASLLAKIDHQIREIRASGKRTGCTDAARLHIRKQREMKSAVVSWFNRNYGTARNSALARNVRLAHRLSKNIFVLKQNLKKQN